MSLACPNCGADNAKFNHYCRVCRAVLAQPVLAAASPAASPALSQLFADQESARWPEPRGAATGPSAYRAGQPPLPYKPPSTVKPLVYAGLAAVDYLALIVAAFLPWITVRISGQDGSMTGLGGLGGVLAQAAQPGASNPGMTDGWIVLIMGLIALIATLFALGSEPESGQKAAKGMIVLGLLAFGWLVVDLFRVMGKLSDLSAYAASAGVSAGLYVGLLAAAVAVVGSALFHGALGDY